MKHRTNCSGKWEEGDLVYIPLKSGNPTIEFICNLLDDGGIETDLYIRPDRSVYINISEIARAAGREI